MGTTCNPAGGDKVLEFTFYMLIFVNDCFAMPYLLQLPRRAVTLYGATLSQIGLMRNFSEQNFALICDVNFHGKFFTFAKF
jgi:hypothetical protein